MGRPADRGAVPPGPRGIPPRVGGPVFENVRAPNLTRLKNLNREDLERFVAENVRALAEDEALAILDNPYCTPRVCTAMAQNARITGFYAVRLRLVAHKKTPQAHAVKLVHYLHWFDLVRLSVDVTVPAPVRRAVDALLVPRVEKLTLGEKVASARRCGSALIKVLLRDPHPRVFEALLANARLREDDLLALIGAGEASPEQLQMVAADPRWSFRRAVRLALVLNPETPRAAAASQLRHFSKRDLAKIHSNPSTSTYLRRCIERLSRDRPT